MSPFPKKKTWYTPQHLQHAQWWRACSLHMCRPAPLSHAPTILPYDSTPHPPMSSGKKQGRRWRRDTQSSHGLLKHTQSGKGKTAPLWFSSCSSKPGAARARSCTPAAHAASLSKDYLNEAAAATHLTAASVFTCTSELTFSRQDDHQHHQQALHYGGVRYGWGGVGGSCALPAGKTQRNQTDSQQQCGLGVSKWGCNEGQNGRSYAENIDGVWSSAHLLAED